MITAQDFETVLRKVPGAINRQKYSTQDLADGANAALLTAPESLSYKGAAAFLATMSQESDSFRATEEYSKIGRYRPYIGRTFEMVTWKENYLLFGQWCKDHGYVSNENVFVDDFKSLADLKWAWLGGIWYWEYKGIWAYADNFLKTQRAVNLGNPNSPYTPVGMTARNQWYQAWLSLGEKLLPEREPDWDNYGTAVLNLDVIPNEWDDKSTNKTIGLKTSLRRSDKEVRAQGVDLDKVLNSLNALRKG